jgi:hypothetical protein
MEEGIETSSKVLRSPFPLARSHVDDFFQKVKSPQHVDELFQTTSPQHQHFTFKADAVRTIQLAIPLSSHVAAASTADEREDRHQAALAFMRTQLKEQQQSYEAQIARNAHLSLATNDVLKQELFVLTKKLELSSASQPIMVPSSSYQRPGMPEIAPLSDAAPLRSISPRPSESAASPRPSASATSGGTIHRLHSKLKSLTKQQTAIARAEAHLALLRSSQDSGIAPKKQSARTREKQIAVLTGDKQFLRSKSDKIHSEENSEDDANDIAAEQGDTVHCHNLMYPTSKIPVKNSHGYVNTPFIKGSDEDTSESGESDPPADDDPSSDYRDSPSKERHHISAEDWNLLQAFKRGTPAPTIDLPAIISALTTQPLQPPQQLDVHGRVLRQHVATVDVALHPPSHGEWDDVEYLLKTYVPLYDKYKASCGEHMFFTSIWEGYSLSQKRRIADFLTKGLDGETKELWSIETLAQLTNEEFISLMCKAKGYNTSSLTETMLRKIRFKEPLTDKANWVNFGADWDECLAQASKIGAIDKKRLILVYRECIPDSFIQTALSQHRFDSWKESHSHMKTQIRNPDFLIAWNADKLSRTKTATRPPQTTGGGNGTGGGGVGIGGGGGGGGGSTPAPKPVTHVTPDLTGVLAYKDKYGNINVNPGLIIDLDLNPQRLICSRCGSTHKWLEPFCTSFKNKAGEIIIPKLSFDENKSRAVAKFQAGFFASKDPSIRPPPRESPSVQNTAASASATTTKLNNH